MNSIYAIYVTICLISNPASCKDEIIELSQENINIEYLNPEMCYKMGMPLLIEFMETHPKWKIKEFHCGKIELKT